MRVKGELNSLMLNNYRGKFPFKLATTSYIYPDEIVPNVTRLAPFFDEIELVLFESKGPDSIPDPVKIDHLLKLSKLHPLGFNIHLPLDLSLGDKSDDVRTHGASITKTMIERTLPLNPSVYTLHLDFTNAPTSPLSRNPVATSLRGSEATEAISKGTRSKKGVQTRSPKKGERGSVQERDIKAWQGRLARSLKEILAGGIEPRQIAIETLGYPFKWVEDVVREFGLSICLDIGHILRYGYDLGYYLKTYLPRTSIIHLHGVHKGSDHLGIETLSEPDLNLILSSLRHYCGIVSIEVFSIRELKSSLSVLEEKWIKS